MSAWEETYLEQYLDVESVKKKLKYRVMFVSRKSVYKNQTGTCKIFQTCVGRYYYILEVIV